MILGCIFGFLVIFSVSDPNASTLWVCMRPRIAPFHVWPWSVVRKPPKSPATTAVLASGRAPTSRYEKPPGVNVCIVEPPSVERKASAPAPLSPPAK